MVKFKWFKIFLFSDFVNMFFYFESDNIGYDLFKILIDVFVLDYFN